MAKFKPETPTLAQKIERFIIDNLRADAPSAILELNRVYFVTRREFQSEPMAAIDKAKVLTIYREKIKQTGILAAINKLYGAAIMVGMQNLGLQAHDELSEANVNMIIKSSKQSGFAFTPFDINRTLNSHRPADNQRRQDVWKALYEQTELDEQSKLIPIYRETKPTIPPEDLVSNSRKVKSWNLANCGRYRKGSGRKGEIRELIEKIYRRIPKKTTEKMVKEVTDYFAKKGETIDRQTIFVNINFIRRDIKKQEIREKALAASGHTLS